LQPFRVALAILALVSVGFAMPSGVATGCINLGQDDGHGLLAVAPTDDGIGARVTVDDHIVAIAISPDQCHVPSDVLAHYVIVANNGTNNGAPSGQVPLMP